MRNRLFIFFILALFYFAVPAKASEVWLGLAGAGDGAGSFGHAFLVFSHNSPLFGQVISYTVAPNQSTSANQAMSVEDFSFSSYKYIYNIVQNRTLTLFKLKLTQSEISNLKKLTEIDLNNQKKGQSTLMYSVTSSNCITHLIELINSVVTEDRQIPIKSFSDSFHPGLESPEKTALNFLNRIPLWMKKYIPQSTIYAGEIVEFEDFNAYRIKFTTASIDKLFSEIRKCNNVSADLIAAMKEMTLFVQKNPDYFEKYKFNNYFTRLKSCDNNKIFYKDFLLALYNGINPLNKSFRSQINSLIAVQK